MAADPLKTNVFGPGHVNASGAFSQPTVNFLHALRDEAIAARSAAEAAQATADSATEAVPVSITDGADGLVQVSGDATSGFTVEGNPAAVMARISLGF